MKKVKFENPVRTTMRPSGKSLDNPCRSCGKEITFGYRSTEHHVYCHECYRKLTKTAK